MQLPEICIKRPVLTVMMNLALVLFGILGLMRLPVRELPDIDPPIVNVTTVYPGANAAVIENDVTEPLEEAINSVQGIKSLVSESNEEVSNITIEFDLSREIDIAAQDVRDRVARVRGKLPDEIDEPIVSKQDADARPMIWVALNSKTRDTLELSRLAENIFKDRLQTVPGVSSVILGGDKRYAIRLWLDPERMAARQITVLDIEDALHQQNVELPSGRVENLDREMTIETKGELKTPEEFNQLVIRHEGSILTRLSDIGHAEKGVEDERSIARYNSTPAVGIGIIKESKANAIQVAKGIETELARIKATLPPDIEASIPYNESTYIDNAIQEVWESLFISFILVVISIYVFLRDARSTLIPSLSIPISAVATFAVLYLFGYSINILSMLALVLALGIVVDDSIVVLENIYRHIENGLKPFDAAFKAMGEISFAVIAITLSLVAVFLPLAFQTSITGRLFIEFAVALCGSIVISAFISLTLTPSFAARILKPISKEDHQRKLNPFLLFCEKVITSITKRYQRTLFWSLEHPIKILSASCLLLLLTVFFYSQLEKEFLPEEDKGRVFSIAITPEGSTSEYTDRMVRKMEDLVRADPNIRGYFSAVALPINGKGKANQGLIFMPLKEKNRKNVRDIVGGPQGLGTKFFTQVEGAIAIPLIPKAIETGFGQTFQLVLQSQDLNQLAKTASDISHELQAAGFLQNVRSSFDFNKPQLELEIDRNRAAVLGISIKDVSRTLQILFGGLDLSKVKLEGKEYDVIVELPRQSRLTPSALDQIYIRNAQGKLIQSSSFISHHTTAGPNLISHYNRLRSATIEATPFNIPLGTAIEKTEKLLQEKLPSDFRYDWTGEGKSIKDAAHDSMFVFIVALVIVYMVLAAQFESLIHPITVMLALPLAIVGAFGGLWLLSMVNSLGVALYGWANFAPDPPLIAKLLSAIVPRIPAMTINLFSQIGIVLLIGLVTKNSILLVEFANQRMAQGKSAKDAMLEAGLVRLRPILMTAFSTIAGMLPIVIGFGAGAESRRPMGIAASGGMITSTFLTLYIVPVVYMMLNKLKKRLY